MAFSPIPELLEELRAGRMVNAGDAAGFEVALIPHTVEHTSFHVLLAGDSVNIEVDLLARYVERLLACRDQ